MSTVRLSLLLLSSLLSTTLLQGACFFAPQIAEQGYSDCQSDDDCPSGRYCGEGYCMPPTWWNTKYAARYQVVISNPGESSLAAGTLAEFSVGENGAISLEQAGFGPSLIVADPPAEKAKRALAMRVPRDSNYAFVIPLPEPLKPGASLGTHWLYVGGDSELAPVYSDPQEVFGYFASFDGDSLDSERFRVDGSIDLNGGRAILRPGAWLVSQDSVAQSSVDFSFQLAGADCHDFGLGLSASHQPQSLQPPYAAFIGDSDGRIQQEVSGHSLPWQQLGEPGYADGLEHMFRVTVVDDVVRFYTDTLLSAELELGEDWSMETLYMHVYSRDCSLKLFELRAAPAALVPPKVKLSTRAMWFE